MNIYKYIFIDRLLKKTMKKNLFLLRNIKIIYLRLVRIFLICEGYLPCALICKHSRSCFLNFFSSSNNAEINMWKHYSFPQVYLIHKNIKNILVKFTSIKCVSHCHIFFWRKWQIKINLCWVLSRRFFTCVNIYQFLYFHLF